MRPAMFAAAILLCASAAQGKCFPSDVSAIAFSTASHRGKIVSLKKVPRGCELIIESSRVLVPGISEAALHCNSRIGAGITFRTKAYCCDEPPCPVGLDNEIRFKLPREEGSHKTVGEIFGAKPEEIQIKIEKWADFARLEQRTDFGEKEVALFRKDLRDYVEISEAERESMLVSLVAMGSREGTMTLPDGIRARWQHRHFLSVRIEMEGAKAKTLVFAPRPWLKSIEW